MTGRVKAMMMDMEEDNTEDPVDHYSDYIEQAEWEDRMMEYITDEDWEKVDEEYEEYKRKHYPTNTTMKWDSDKEPLAWIPAECMQGIAKVLAYGAEKYEKDNWRRGIPMSRYISAALRHIHAWNNGEDLDPESGMSHIDHAMCGLMFVQWYIKHRPECDDRYKDDRGIYQAEVTPPSYGG